jgi:hypothetical protein
MKVGFTGSHSGMSLAQQKSLADLFRGIEFSEFHHGDCIGADVIAHRICLENSNRPIVIHPPVKDTKRAFCTGANVTILPTEPYLIRNQKIVLACDLLIATPRTGIESLRSGTWSTVRFARKRGKQYIIILPDGVKRG